MQACLDGNLNSVEDLVNAGSDIEYRDMRGRSLIHYAALSGSVAMFKFFVNRDGDPESRDRSGNTVMHTVCLYNDSVDIVNYLIDTGCDIDAINEMGERPIHSAAMNKSPWIVKILVDRGGDFQSTDENGNTVMHTVCLYNDSVDLVKYLIDKGCDIEASNIRSQRPIHCAASSNHRDVVNYLLDRGCEYDVEGSCGQRLIHLAARTGNIDVVNYLIERGCEYDVKDRFGRKPIHHAAASGSVAMVKLFVDKGCDFECINKYWNDTINVACNNGNNEDVIYYLIEVGRKIMIRDGSTMLHCSSKKNFLNFTQLLIEHGFDINARNDFHQTPLYCSVQSDNTDTAMCLIAHNCDIHLNGPYGTVLDYAKVLDRQKHIDLLELMSEREELNMLDTQCQTDLETEYTEIISKCTKCHVRENDCVLTCGHVFCCSCVDRVKQCFTCYSDIINTLKLFID